MLRRVRGCRDRGGLRESMESVDTAQPVEDFDDLVKVIARSLKPFAFTVLPEMVHVLPYARDKRIGWHSHIIMIEGYGVWGFADGPISD